MKKWTTPVHGNISAIHCDENKKMTKITYSIIPIMISIIMDNLDITMDINK